MHRMLGERTHVLCTVLVDDTNEVMISMGTKHLVSQLHRTIFFSKICKILRYKFYFLVVKSDDQIRLAKVKVAGIQIW